MLTTSFTQGESLRRSMEKQIPKLVKSDTYLQQSIVVIFDDGYDVLDQNALLNQASNIASALNQLNLLLWDMKS